MSEFDSITPPTKDKFGRPVMTSRRAQPREAETVFVERASIRPSGQQARNVNTFSAQISMLDRWNKDGTGSFASKSLRSDVFGEGGRIVRPGAPQAKEAPTEAGNFNRQPGAPAAQAVTATAAQPAAAAQAVEAASEALGPASIYGGEGIPPTASVKEYNRILADMKNGLIPQAEADSALSFFKPEAATTLTYFGKETRKSSVVEDLRARGTLKTLADDGENFALSDDQLRALPVQRALATAEASRKQLAKMMSKADEAPSLQKPADRPRPIEGPEQPDTPQAMFDRAQRSETSFRARELASIAPSSRLPVRFDALRRELTPRYSLSIL